MHFERKWNPNITLQYGSQWFSITHDFAKYFLSQESWVRKYFRFTSVPDEMVMQTVIYNSLFLEKLYQKERNGDYHASVRMIDWERGDPYVFREEDFTMLIQSDRLFARKFSNKVDKNIIAQIFAYLMSKKDGHI